MKSKELRLPAGIVGILELQRDGTKHILEASARWTTRYSHNEFPLLIELTFDDAPIPIQVVGHRHAGGIVGIGFTAAKCQTICWVKQQQQWQHRDAHLFGYV